MASALNVAKKGTVTFSISRRTRDSSMAVGRYFRNVPMSSKILVILAQNGFDVAMKRGEEVILVTQHLID
jgi:hypothetical protein